VSPTVPHQAFRCNRERADQLHRSALCAREAAALALSVPVDDEHGTSLHRGPLAKAFPVTKFVRRFFVGVRDRNRDRADRVMLVRGATAVQALAIGLVKALHLFDQVVPHLLLVVFAHRLAPPRVPKSLSWPTPYISHRVPRRSSEGYLDFFSRT
jgi:hypothetical protein